VDVLVLLPDRCQVEPDEDFKARIERFIGGRDSGRRVIQRALWPTAPMRLRRDVTVLKPALLEAHF
jgi:hypothetical protein